MKRMATALALVAAVSFASFANAEILWDQSSYDEFGPGFFNSESGEPPFGITMHAVCDVTVDGAGWTVDTITTYYSAIDPNWGLAIVDGYLHVFDKTGPLPIDGTDDPTSSPIVSMTGTVNGSVTEVVATGLSLNLPPGEYWIGITPIAPAGFFGPEIHLSTTDFIGDASASYDPFGIPAAWFNFNPDTDASILVEGTRNDPVPTHELTWGRLKANR